MKILPKHSVIFSACAKVNLALHITGKQENGYHLLESLVVFTRFCDTLAFSESAQDQLLITGEFAGLLSGEEENLVHKARHILKERSCQKEVFPVSISLEKRIPVAAGIGGGSADAAATLKALNSFWNVHHPNDVLHELAFNLGADVPLCLWNRPLIASGVGHIIKPIRKFPGLYMVLVNPGEPLATQAVFRLRNLEALAPLPPLPETLLFHQLISWLKTCRNDLLPSACTILPSICDILSALDFHGAAFSGMSGSGATCFGLFDTKEKAEDAACILKIQMPERFVIATETNHSI